MNIKKAHRRAYVIAIALLLYLISSNLFAQLNPPVLQTELEDLEVGGEWLYGDLNKGIALAKESSKPLFVLFR